MNYQGRFENTYFLSDTFVLSSPAEASTVEHILRFRAVNYTMY